MKEGMEGSTVIKGFVPERIGFSFFDLFAIVVKLIILCEI
jgi:hypothetical protein